MSDPHAGLTAGTFHVTAQERVVFGMPAGEAIVAEADAGRRQARVRHLDALAGAEGDGAAAAHREGARGPPCRDLCDHQIAQPARGRGGRRRGGARGQGRPARCRRRRLGDRRHQGHATLPLGRARQSRGHGALLRRLRPHQELWSCRCRRTRSAWSRSRPRCRPPSSPRMPASPSRRPTPSSPSATACSRRAPWCSTPPPRSTRRTGCCSARASAPSTTRSRPTATRGHTRRRRRCRCKACGCSLGRCRPSSRRRAIWRRGSRRSSACGRRLRRRPRAFRRAPATASAMRWAPPSALRMGTPPA